MSSEAEASLAAALQNLKIAWEEVRVHWRDAKCLEFEARYLKELPSRASQAATIMSDIEKILRKIKHDCA